MLLTFSLSVIVSAAPVSIAVPGVSCVGLDQSLCESFLERFVVVLTERASVRVVAQLLGYERQRQLLGCTDANSSSCMAELAGALGVDGILSIWQEAPLHLLIDNEAGSLKTPNGSFSLNTPFYLIANCPGGSQPLTDCTVRMNGLTLDMDSVGNTSQPFNTNGLGMSLGKPAASSFQGDVSELMLYGPLSAAEVTLLESYLRTKYGL